MSDDPNEITLREAVVERRPRPVAPDDPEQAAREKRAREVGNAGATLDAMLGASRRGKTVRGG